MAFKTAIYLDYFVTRCLLWAIIKTFLKRVRIVLCLKEII